MIGGQVIIPITDRNGKEIELATTSKNIKLGTFAKIERAIKLQKEVVITGINISGFYFTAGAPIAMTRQLGATYVFKFRVEGTAGDGTSAAFNIFIYADDTAIYANA